MRVAPSSQPCFVEICIICSAEVRRHLWNPPRLTRIGRVTISKSITLISHSSRISSSITGEKRIQNQVRMILIDTSQWIVRRLVFADRLKLRYFSMASTLLSTNVDSTMKKLIDAQQYQEALHVFEEHSHSKSLSDISFNLALKACTKLRSYQRGTEIHRQLSSHSLLRSSNW